MKQIQECLDRVFAGKPPLKKKWRAKIEEAWLVGERWLLLYHYHHLVLAYDIDAHEVRATWWEYPTDKRGLDAALHYLEVKFYGQKSEATESGETQRERSETVGNGIR